MTAPKVFLSHASEDKDRFVVGFARQLRENGVDVWLDQWEMKPGDSLVDKIFEVVKDVYAQGVTVVLVEQNASRALAIANRGYVMESGIVTMSGDAAQMLTDPRVRAAYLGE